ncbi:MAG: histidine kinase [Chitinophagaceae bacterium]|nr:MAG: histidine kinase [Chitinophagaceae bacterium]
MKRRSDLFALTYTDNRYRIVLHLFFWLVMFLGYYYFNTISFNPVRGTPATYLLAVQNIATTCFAFYSLMYFIWPRFLAKKKWLQGTLLLFIWIIASATINSLADWLIFNRCESCGQQLATYSPDYYNFLQRNFLDIVFVRVITGGFAYMLLVQLSLPAAIKISRSYFRQTVQQLQLAKDNLQLEFNFLKSQVNPHFLFNTLNNIYSLVVAERNSQAAATISRLSGFMRYTLYETGDDKISLEKEIQLLKDYIELEKLRLNAATVVFNVEADRDDYLLPPLLLMPALENAFKYTVDKEGSQIIVDIKAFGGMLKVSIQNNFDAAKTINGGGIGLQNLQRRLQHSYGNAASYSASAANDVYLFRLSCTIE